MVGYNGDWYLLDKMKIRILSILVFILSGFWILVSTFKWFLKDAESLALLGWLIGFAGIGAGILYSWLKDFEERLDKMDKRIDALVSFWTKEELGITKK